MTAPWVGCLVVGMFLAGCGGSAENTTPAAVGESVADGGKQWAPDLGQPGSVTADVTITDPNNMAPKSTWIQLALIKGNCPTEAALAQGQISQADAILTPAPIGEKIWLTGLPAIPVAVVGMARKADCSVIAFGCTQANFNQHKHVTVEIRPVQPEGGGACEGGQTCQNGLCSAP